jgi:predicted MPP superfamily phosphohydrolase
MGRYRSLLVVIGLLALLHIYIGIRLTDGMELGPGAAVAAWALLLACFVLTPLGLVAPRVRRWDLSDRFTWAGLLTMGFFSSLLVLTFLRDLLLLVLELGGGASPGFAYGSAVSVPVLALAVTVVGYFNARRTARVVNVDVPLRGLPPELDGFTIVQITDVHVGPTIKRKYIDAIVDRVNSLEADAIAVTGDIVDGTVARLGEHTAPLGRLSARDGVFFVTGNHEYYSGAREWIAEMRRLGMNVLLNEHAIVERGGESLMIAGVTDYNAHHFDPGHRSDPYRATERAPADVRARILLAHQPRTALAAQDAGFDLQISGHTHGGQFFPWNLFVPLQQPYVAGLNRLGNMWIYTSRGTGYWGPPKRFGAPSEITRIRLVPA